MIEIAAGKMGIADNAGNRSSRPEPFISSPAPRIRRPFFQRLHALDLTTGGRTDEQARGDHHATIGYGAGANVGASVPAIHLRQNQRQGLVCSCEWCGLLGCPRMVTPGPYQWWLIGEVDTTRQTLQRSRVYNDTKDGSDGGLWMSGQAPQWTQTVTFSW